jgi:hypothetical protein
MRKPHAHTEVEFRLVYSTDVRMSLMMDCERSVL